MNRNITALILLVLAVGVYFTYTSGQIGDIQAAQETNAQYAAAIANAQKLIQIRDSVLAQYNSISDTDKARLDEIVPNNVDNVRLMIDVSGIAARHGLTAAGITTSADTENPAGSQSQSSNSGVSSQPAGLATVSVSFTVSTTYQNFLAFLGDIERSLRILDVTSITLTPASNGIYTYGVTLDTYWLKQ